MARIFETDIVLNAQRELRLADADSSAYVGFKAPATITASLTWTLPSADGSPGQVLGTNGSGTLFWTTPGGGGGGSTNASDLTSGTLAIARLPAKVRAAVNFTLWSNFR